MHYNDNDHVLSKIFYKDYCEWYHSLLKMQSLTQKSSFADFIDEKDIGLLHIKFLIYEIIDEKKWLLAKLKYGI